MPYAFEVHHKPEHDTESLRPDKGGSIHVLACSLFEVVISKAMSKYVMLLSEHVAKIVIIFLKQTFFQEKMKKMREGAWNGLLERGKWKGNG